MASTSHSEEPSLLDKIDEMVPAPFAQFDAFPKLPTTYKARSESRGFLTLFVAFAAFLLVLNDLGEYIWGWPVYDFTVDSDPSSDLKINVDMMVNMPCAYLSVDLRDAMGDRLYLSNAFRRDGTKFDIGQATTLQEHAAALSARQVIAQSRKSRGFFSNLFRRTNGGYKATYNHQPDGSACRVFGSITAKKVTANLHITTLGHGYATHSHVDHSKMNLSHVITEFSFGPHFPDITQPLDNSFEVAHDPFVAYQYFLHVVPTTYIAPRSSPLHTHQYSVTHYTRILDPSHHRHTPGIFFKFDLDPLAIKIEQRTTSLVQLAIRCVGVIGGVFVCMGYAVKITTHAVDAVTGADKTQGIVAAEASGIGGIRKRWGSSDLRLRPGSAKVVRQGSGWAVEGGSPYSSYAGTPVAAGFSPTYGVNGAPSPAGVPPPVRQSSYGLGLGSPHVATTPGVSPGLSPAAGPEGAFPTAATAGSPYGTSPAATPGTGVYSHFPPTPNPTNGNGLPRSPVPGTSGFTRKSSNGDASGRVKDD
ncbi:hypothetical protein CERSUDRAFT_117979 [Gelatoporia subvermispora B]|uniref:DUF1692-domain-containing protein n=1 Tax=Ceriporiopsis subvermispora (strain B) TaxID=914234 RepID=M2R379_CERS8|nr:hypothetical protein CERSUDRAFT_117979 [Gelatoporia subvermispora B]